MSSDTILSNRFKIIGNDACMLHSVLGKPQVDVCHLELLSDYLCAQRSPSRCDLQKHLTARRKLDSGRGTNVCERLHHQGIIFGLRVGKMCLPKSSTGLLGDHHSPLTPTTVRVLMILGAMYGRYQRCQCCWSNEKRLVWIAGHSRGMRPLVCHEKIWQWVLGSNHDVPSICKVCPRNTLPAYFSFTTTVPLEW